MANILLVDPADIARKAMKGILARGGHHLALASTTAEAWEFVKRNVAVDLVILELKLPGENGLVFMQRVRGDLLLKHLPVVVYASAGDRDSVHQAVQLKAQNFLMKPYRDDVVFAEVAKALANPWRSRQFEEERSFCAMMGYTPAGLRGMLDTLRAELTAAPELMLPHTNDAEATALVAQLAELGSDAEAAGAWGVVELLQDLRDRAEREEWEGFKERLPAITMAERIVFAYQNPEIIPEDFISDEERAAEAEAKARAHWFNAPAEGRCPVVTWPQIAAQLDALTGAPVIDTAAASFQMAATGHPSSLSPLMDLGAQDPGLCAQLIVSANRMRRHDDALNTEPLENPQVCVSLLGEERLASIARGLVLAEERRLGQGPCNWARYWTFQVGVAHMARYTCRYLEFHSLEPRAYTAGLLHDIGKLLLLHLYPIGFQAALDHAVHERVPLAVAEELYFGCTTRTMAAHFAAKHEFLPGFVSTMRWVDDPRQAGDDAVLVASVSLAREICAKNNVGWSCDTTGRETHAIALTPAWEILGQRIFPSFDLGKFEAEAMSECLKLKEELRGATYSAR